MAGLQQYYDYHLRTPFRPAKVDAWGFDISRARRFGAPVGRIPATHFMLSEEWHILAGDEFPTPASWPDLWRAMLFNPHKDRRDRYRLFVFLWGNGMQPHHAVFWVMWHGGYDRSAWNSIIDAANDTLTDAGRSRLRSAPIYSLEAGRVI